MSETGSLSPQYLREKISQILDCILKSGSLPNMRQSLAEFRSVTFVRRLAVTQNTEFTEGG